MFVWSHLLQQQEEVSTGFSWGLQTDRGGEPGPPSRWPHQQPVSEIVCRMYVQCPGDPHSRHPLAGRIADRSTLVFAGAGPEQGGEARGFREGGWLRAGLCWPQGGWPCSDVPGAFVSAAVRCNQAHAPEPRVFLQENAQFFPKRHENTNDGNK